jgi:hypothetical protein
LRFVVRSGEVPRPACFSPCSLLVADATMERSGQVSAALRVRHAWSSNLPLLTGTCGILLISLPRVANQQARSPPAFPCFNYPWVIATVDGGTSWNTIISITACCYRRTVYTYSLTIHLHTSGLLARCASNSAGHGSIDRSTPFPFSFLSSIKQ